MGSRKVKFALMTWAVVAIGAVANGAFRGVVLQSVFDETVARMISCFMLIAILLSISYYFLKRSELRFTDKELLVVGLAWLGLTLVFEFGFGHYVVGKTLDELLVDYDIMKGRLWILVLAFTMLSPLLVGRKLRSTLRTAGSKGADGTW